MELSNEASFCPSKRKAGPLSHILIDSEILQVFLQVPTSEEFVDVFTYLHTSGAKKDKTYQHGACQTEHGANQSLLSILKQLKNQSTNVHCNSNDSRPSQLEKLVCCRASLPPTLLREMTQLACCVKTNLHLPKKRQPEIYHLLLDANKQHS